MAEKKNSVGAILDALTAQAQAGEFDPDPKKKKKAPPRPAELKRMYEEGLVKPATKKEKPSRKKRKGSKSE